jgi:hypothetical protein
MALLYFGANRPVYSSNGNWTDTSQWYTTLGYYDKSGGAVGTLAGRLPTEADTVYCIQYITSNFPTTWAGNFDACSLGSPTVNATGTYSGIIKNLNVYGTTSAPTFSGTVYGASCFGGYFTGTLSGLGGYYITLRNNTLVATNITNIYYLSMTGGTVNGSLSGTGTFNTIGGTVNGTLGTSGAIFINGGTVNSTNNSISCNQFSYTSGTLTNITGITSASLITLTGFTSSANLVSGGTMTITNCNLSGSISFSNISNAYLIIQKNSTIAADISTSVSNCAKFKISSGTFTNSSPWIFGTSSFAATVNIGCEVFSNYSNGVYSYTFESLTISKDITIYTNSTKTNYINSPQNFGGAAGSVFSPSLYGTFIGLINFLPTTGGTVGYITVGGGSNYPTKTISATLNGSNYNISYLDLPYDWGFVSPYRFGVFSPTVYVSGLPSGIDVLSTLV